MNCTTTMDRYNDAFLLSSRPDVLDGPNIWVFRGAGMKIYLPNGKETKAENKH